MTQKKGTTPIDGKVFMTLLNGPFANRKRDVTRAVPAELIAELTRDQTKWLLDLAQADHIQRLEWAKADMGGRILDALLHGRPVRFNKRIYMAASPEEYAEVGGRLEDAIFESGYNVFVEADDESGVTIGIHSKETPKN